MSAEADELRRLLPHRPPILCLDRVVEVGAEHAVGERTVGEGPDVERGELWEVGLIEGLAQTAALIHGNRVRGGGPLSGRQLLAEVRSLKIDRRARVGERVRFRADLVKHLAPVVLLRCEASVEEATIASGEMKVVVEEQGA